MELHFLGTGSAYPSPKRSSSCTILRHDKGLWLFDCGEGSQIQLQKSTLRPGRIKKIFITHLHGDHLFGLPGLMCTIGMNNSLTGEQRVDIYGPTGLKNFIRSSLMLSYSNLPYNFAVHELCIPSYQDFYSRETVGMDDSYWQKLNDLSSVTLPLHPNEVEGTIIKPNTDGIYNICHEDSLHVFATSLKHTVPCVGFVIQEDNLPGKLDVNILKNKGVPPGPLFGKIKSGESIELPNGTIVSPEECVGPSRKGRKIAIFGDTSSSENMIGLAQDCDILVHEATNEDCDEEKSISHGHSSAGMAGAFARRIQAKKLIITHFSQRYRNADEEIKEGTESVTKLVEQSKLAFKNDEVIAAEDLLVVPIPLPK